MSECTSRVSPIIYKKIHGTFSQDYALNALKMNRKRKKLNKKLPEFNKKLHKLNRKLPKLKRKVKVDATSNSSGADYEIPILDDDFKSFQIPVKSFIFSSDRTSCSTLLLLLTHYCYYSHTTSTTLILLLLIAYYCYY